MNEPGEQLHNSGETSKPPVEQRLREIATQLGFEETPELTQIRRKLAPDQLIEESTAIINDYQILGEAVIEKRKDSDDPKPQIIGLIVAVAGIKHANGFNDGYREDMNQAIMYATNIGDHDTSLKLRHILLENLEGRERKIRK